MRHSFQAGKHVNNISYMEAYKLKLASMSFLHQLSILASYSILSNSYPACYHHKRHKSIFHGIRETGMKYPSFVGIYGKINRKARF